MKRDIQPLRGVLFLRSYFNYWTISLYSLRIRVNYKEQYKGLTKTGLTSLLYTLAQ